MKFSKLNNNTSRITYLMGWGNYTRVFLVDSSPELNSTTLKKCVGTLPGFIRLSKSLAVNPNHILQIRRKGDRSADVLVNGNWLPVSRRRVSSVVRQLQDLPGSRVKGLTLFRTLLDEIRSPQEDFPVS
ncbi:LytTR family transcriptional regulator DNA-binding domain-containing protein [Spirosoma sp. RP8]|uniref:LytTR family transcriptional regulator DNA-binding domain-containing protein n=1 Tax=Spirosoma liriopis TaxID=2937440 RepID=A0ABT0HLY2_9BACT|nr:LytTR family transcriptional regulator DNA-binding domain-containing protein [Spirosoma liriopis]MCK8493185.1 LytTR family transcriptional regulator DNA-binding domain-containing protein [Spirosoma liriopis]